MYAERKGQDEHYVSSTTENKYIYEKDGWIDCIAASARRSRDPGFPWQRLLSTGKPGNVSTLVPTPPQFLDYTSPSSLLFFHLTSSITPDTLWQGFFIFSFFIYLFFLIKGPTHLNVHINIYCRDARQMLFLVAIQLIIFINLLTLIVTVNKYGFTCRHSYVFDKYKIPIHFTIINHNTGSKNDLTAGGIPS